MFRIGASGSYSADPGQRQALPGSVFPAQAFEQFVKQGVPRWSTNDAATQAAYDAYVQKACPCVILVHSQGGNFAFQAALNQPDKIKAIIAVETSGSPDLDKTDFSLLRKIPMLWVWGDNINQYPLWQSIQTRQEKFRTNLVAAGGTADKLSLPDAGLKGNSHVLMMDRNSDAVAALVQNWLVKQGLAQ